MKLPMTLLRGNPRQRLHPLNPLSLGFTLVEILVSLFVLSILLLISAQVIGQVQDTWTASNARISQFREARTAFDIIIRNVSQATLNSYVDYDQNYLSEDVTNAAASSGPSSYLRKSDLQFVCGPAETYVQGAGAGADYLPGHALFFQAPLGIAQDPQFAGLDRLLCGRGYFVQFSSDAFFAPDFLETAEPRFRYRLMEFSPPAEENRIYDDSAGVWYAEAGAPMNEDETATDLSLNRPVSDNIIALIVSPRQEPDVDAAAAANGRAINDSAVFDSTQVAGANPNNAQGTQHLLPPMLKVLLVAIDERSAARLADLGSAEEPPLANELGQFQETIDSGAASDQAITTAVTELSEALGKKRLNFRIFSATVPIRASKWIQAATGA